MDRLTRKCGDEYLQPLYLANSGHGFTSTKEIVNRLAEYEDTGLTPEEIKAKVELRENCFNHMKKNYEKLLKMWDSTCDGYVTLWKELQVYKDAEEQGLLIKLPCKVTDTVYHVHEGEVKEYTISKVGGTDLRVTTEHNYNPCLCQFNSETIGKTIFLAREAAEEALNGGAHD